ncbi:hypothetical protein [Desulfitobacterium metallireducens]|uniref:Uncharacterized protein n=1 Tax=Desulfitobacterium metallireducens DSM 15288 TaxID=871968 RepID=W0EHE5_9FIRM|nr:hypothetical protein [Desulfitobacterium metallireducens]AHF08496.1 hypothetical protein DESME_05235 [Desulfitobacterium metallireducens DSM 15288]
MVVGFLISLSGCLLYWLLKPPAFQESFIQEKEVELLKQPLVDFETGFGVPQ